MHTVQLGSELPTELSVRRGMGQKRGHNSGMAPVKPERQEQGERGELLRNAWDLCIVLSGFATTDLSVRFRDACQGAEPMEKRPPCGPFPFYTSRDRSGFSKLYTHAPAAAAAERQQPSVTG